MNRPDSLVRRRLALGAVALALAPRARAEERVRISGSGSGTGGMQLLALAFMRSTPGVQVEVLPALGSTGGIRALLLGGIDIAVSNRAPNHKETAHAPVQTTLYANTPFVVAVHRDLGITALSGTELAALYHDSGARFANGHRARPVLRLADATDTDLLKAMDPAMALALATAARRRGMLDAATDSECADLIEHTPGAFGPSTLALIESEKRPLVALAINGIAPSLDNLAARRYAYSKSLLMVLAAKPSAPTQAFFDFARSLPARRLLATAGHGEA